MIRERAMDSEVHSHMGISADIQEVIAPPHLLADRGHDRGRIFDLEFRRYGIASQDQLLAHHRGQP